MTSNTVQNSTKEKILDAAFSFFSSPCFEMVSLNEIAKKVGISKTAIYRHFKNKDALVYAMHERFFKIFIDFSNTTLKHLTSKKSFDSEFFYKVFLKNTVKYLLDHSEYLFFIFYTLANPLQYKREVSNHFQNYLKDQNFDLSLIKTLFGVKVENDKCSIFDIEKYSAALYASSTIAFYCLDYVSKKDEKDFSLNNFSTSISNLLELGIETKENWVTFERMEELDKMCFIDFTTLPPLNPIFKIISDILCEEGFAGVTVESIAKKMGKAKSSLYTYFDTKESLILNLLSVELINMTETILRICNTLTDKTEIIYVFFKLIGSYFINRSEIFTVFKWTRFSDAFTPDYQSKYFSSFKKYSNDEVLTFETTNFQVTRKTFFTWIGVTASVLLIHFNDKDWSFEEEDFNKTIKICFDFIQRGLSNATEKK